jgi:aryl sulfotransferase
MADNATMLAPPRHGYRGAITDPDRWATWVPRQGDILVCTPPKCGTTWTQTILAMLVHGGPDLPEKLPFLSPWIDADLGVSGEEVAAALVWQEGRRVVKTHTPADGFPIWDGETVIAVYRHPLDAFFSLRKHTANRSEPVENNPMAGPLSQALQAYLEGSMDRDDFDRDTLATLTAHYTETVLAGRLPQVKLFHYSNMMRDPRQAVADLAIAAGINASKGLIDTVTEATSFGAMKSKAADFAPVGGTGFWKSDAGFFDSASSRKWEGQLSAQELAHFEARLVELVPDEAARRWLEHGTG